jgi:hypothetical protein
VYLLKIALFSEAFFSNQQAQKREKWSGQKPLSL